MTDDKVTVIGLGSMGTAVAEAFIGAGHPTTVWNRTPYKAAPLTAKGAIHAEAIEDAVAAHRGTDAADEGFELAVPSPTTNGPDFHRQATTSFRNRSSTTHSIDHPSPTDAQENKL
jgi:3-hydroxyacyl-CoA dehydrogenase